MDNTFQGYCLDTRTTRILIGKIQYDAYRKQLNERYKLEISQNNKHSVLGLESIKEW